MILYGTQVNGVNHEMGTSGFLFRSNKLMYDRATQSLWSTLWGKPVIGPLVGKGIALEPMTVVTTDWATWRARHPDTLVLAEDTGHIRDYGEGVAYREYFATDELMFPVPHKDQRLDNKREIFALRLTGGTPMAISIEHLANHPLLQLDYAGKRILVLTDASGANRAYESADFAFENYDGESLTDTSGNAWVVTESSLDKGDGTRLRRLPGHRAFWFGWRAAYPRTTLIH